MILTDFDYVKPATLGEATALLTAEGSRPLGGGQSLLVELRTGEGGARRLVDLGRVPELAGITRTAAGHLRIGAMTPLAVLAAHPEVRRTAPALAEAAGACGDPQVRNLGTVGGNLAAQRVRGANDPWTYATDLPAAVLAEGAIVHLAGKEQHTLSAEAFAHSGLPAGGLLTAVELPSHRDGRRSAFEKTADRATRHPVCAVAVSGRRGADGTVTGLRIAVTGATARATLLAEETGRLEGTAPTTETVLAAFRRRPGALFVAGRGASAEYVGHLAGVLTARALARITAD